MAFTKFLIITLLFVAVQGFMKCNEDDWPCFPPMKMSEFYIPTLPPLPPLLPMPAMPDFPEFPAFPAFPAFPEMLPMPAIEVPDIPSPAEIAKIKPGPDQIYNGVAVKSTSDFKRDKEGNIIRTGGSTILTNTNGDVKETKVGDNPPNIDDPIIIPTMPKMPKMPKMPDIPVINPDTIRTHVPGENEEYVAVSSSSFSHTSDINGKKSAVGGSDFVSNINGAVDKESVRFGKKPKKN